jgi:hypothetical protein
VVEEQWKGLDVMAGKCRVRFKRAENEDMEAPVIKYNKVLKKTVWSRSKYVRWSVNGLTIGVFSIHMNWFECYIKYRPIMG